MKYFLSITALFLVYFTSNAQETDSLSNKEDSVQIQEIEFEELPEEEVDEIFTIVEQPASFPGGIQEFYNYLSKNIVYPQEASDKGVEGRIFVQFIVEKDGTLSNIKVIKGIGAGCDEEAVRVISSSPAWIPAMNRKEKVRMNMIQNINFNLGKSQKNKQEKDN